MPNNHGVGRSKQSKEGQMTARWNPTSLFGDRTEGTLKHSTSSTYRWSGHKAHIHPTCPTASGQRCQAALQSSDCGTWDLGKGRNLQPHPLALSSPK